MICVYDFSFKRPVSFFLGSIREYKEEEDNYMDQEQIKHHANANDVVKYKEKN